MVDDVEPRAGELTTVNYGWTKPTVGSSADAWGGYINTNLDGIDSTVKTVSNSVPAAAVIAPVMDGAAAVGASPAFARSDHIHPSDTSRYATSNPAGYQTATQVAASIAAQPVAMNDNRIINGDMRIDARNNGVSAQTINVYTVDRWLYGASQAAKGQWQRIALGLTALAAQAGFPSSLSFVSLSAFASAATDNFYFLQKIEADTVSDFAWGSAAAQPVTLSFWAQSSLTGTFSGSIANDLASRVYPFTFSLPVANVFTKIVVTIPGDTGSPWVMSGNGAAVMVRFDLGCGANFRGPAGAWTAAGNYIGATGSQSIVAVNAATFYVTGVKLEIGAIATPYPRQSLAKSQADCQRYYSVGQMIANSWGNTSGNVYFSTNLPVTMRATPTLTTPVTGSLINISGFAAGGYNGTSVYFGGTATTAGAVQVACSYTASAEL